MPESLVSSLLGRLRPGAQLADCWDSPAPVPVPFFAEAPSLSVAYMDVPVAEAEAADFLASADEAMRRFLALGAAARHAATPLAVANYEENRDAAGLEPLALPVPDDIWRYVTPRGVYVQRDPYEGAADQYVQVECECAWEEEHGLQLVFREGRMLTRLSQRDGHLTEGNAYDQPDDLDPLMQRYLELYPPAASAGARPAQQAAPVAAPPAAAVRSSAALGPMQAHPCFPQWWVSAPVELPLFANAVLPVTWVGAAADNEFAALADAAWQHWQALPANQQQAAARAVWDHCQSELARAQQPPLPGANPAAVWACLRPTAVQLNRRPWHDRDVYVQVLAEGVGPAAAVGEVQLVFRQGRMLTRVSDNDFYLTEADARNVPGAEDPLMTNFAATFSPSAC